MRVRSLCIVKNEGDVIAESLVAAATWSDRIYVFDNGSTDATWDIVRALAREHEEIVPFKQDGQQFHDGLRSEIYHRYKDEAQPDDWWCALPADELYIDDPRVFLAKVPRGDRTVWNASFSYYFTDLDRASYEEHPERYAPTVPVASKVRHYLNHWSEIRFFRHDDGIVWDDGCWPVGLEAAPAYPVRIWLRHFPYRSPEQIDLRLRTRAPLVAAGVFLHEAIPGWADVIDADGIAADPRRGMDRASPEVVPTWLDRVVDHAHLDFDAHDNRFVVHEELMPPLPPSSAQAGATSRRSRLALRSLRHSGRRTLRQL